MVGYCAVHLLEHTINAHFHYGEETHHDEFVSARTGYSVLGGLSVHALFDGVAIGSGFVVNNALGWLIFLAIFLHKAPEGFTMARHAGQRSQPDRSILFRGCSCGCHPCWRAGDRTGATVDALRPARFRRRRALCRR